LKVFYQRVNCPLDNICCIGLLIAFLERFLNRILLKSIDRWLFVPASLGLLAYAFITQFHRLNPFDVDWLLPFWRGSIDSAQHYLGWEFFRQAPLLQWPPGKSPNLGPLAGSGVALTDSLPLFAFIFKPFTFWFNQPFQYFGIWVLTCFVLQAVFAWKLLTIWVKHWQHAVLGTYFFCFAPIFIDRMTVHLALAGHWVILAGLYLLFSRKTTIRHWLILAVVSMLVQPYLAIICAALFVAWSLIEVVSTRAVFQYVFRLFTFIGVLFGAGWSSGLFIFGLGSTKAAGFGTYSANALSWVDPGFPWYEKVLWSRHIPDQWQNTGQYEGMNFLGSGILMLVVIELGFQLVKGNWKSRGIQTMIIVSFVTVFGRNNPTQRILVFLLGALFAVVSILIHNKFSENRSKAVIYILLFGSLMSVAFTNQVFIGDFLIANFSIPIGLNDVLSIVRTSGRLLWPITYLLVTALIVIVSRDFRKRSATGLFLLALFIQSYESAGALGVTRSMFTRPGPGEFLVSPLWDSFGEKYQNIVIVLPNENVMIPPTNLDFNPLENSFLWRELGVFAVEHEMTLNSFYFSREPLVQNRTESDVLTDVVSQGEYRTDSLYVFIDSAMWEMAKQKNGAGSLVQVLDSIPILAPNM
jgi:hypothetical protein